VELASRLIDKVQEIPTLPTVYSSLSIVLANPQTSTQSVSNLIASDQASTSKILKVVNSAFYGYQGKIDTISRALIILGFNEIYNLILSSALMDFFKKKETVLDFRPVDFWGHSIAVGIATKLIGQTLGLANQENFFISGILHDIGKLVFFEYAEDEFADALALSKKNRQTLQTAELSTFGMDHAMVGALIAEKWRLPSSIIQAIRYHQRGLDPERNDLLVPIVHLANILCRALELGYPGDDFIPRPNPQALETIHLKPGSLENIVPDLLRDFEVTVQFLL